MRLSKKKIHDTQILRNGFLSGMSLAHKIHTQKNNKKLKGGKVTFKKAMQASGISEKL